MVPIRLGKSSIFCLFVVIVFEINEKNPAKRNTQGRAMPLQNRTISVMQGQVEQHLVNICVL